MPSLRVESDDVGRGQVHGVITAAVDDVDVGQLRFTDFPDMRGGRTCQIELIEVDEEHRRKGIATELIARLRSELPGSRPAQFYMTDDARALKDAIYDDFAAPIAPNDGKDGPGG